MTTEPSRRHSEALRLFEAGLKAFYEATGTNLAPTWARTAPDDGQPDRLLDPRPPAAPPERARDISESV